MVDPHEVFSSLYREAKNERTKRTLKAIHNICMEQVERGSNEISVSMISRLGADKGVPQAGAIRNKSGKNYQILIKAWRDSRGFKKKVTPDHKYDWIDNIDDQVTQFLVHSLVAELNGLRSQLRRSESLERIIDLRGKSKSEDQGISIKLLSTEYDALKSAISDDHLAKMSWKADNRGRIKDESGKQIFKVGFRTSIEKILSIEGKK
ncbi:MAG: hypothetical protein JKX76_03290 [Colwellia sp.]|nr:hypothetical protein [Colwellia sp.]